MTTQPLENKIREQDKTIDEIRIDRQGNMLMQ